MDKLDMVLDLLEKIQDKLNQLEEKVNSVEFDCMRIIDGLGFVHGLVECSNCGRLLQEEEDYDVNEIVCDECSNHNCPDCQGTDENNLN